MLVYTLIALSTIPFFKGSYGRGLMLLCVIFLHNYIIKSFKREAIIVLLIVFTLELYHFTYFPNYDAWMFRQVITFFLLAIFISYHLKLAFLDIYVKIMYVITIISLFFFFGLLASPESMHFIDDSVPNIFRSGTEYFGETKIRVNPIIYNFDYNFYKIRNNGPFWEPTVFASLLLIGQIFNFILHKKFFNKIGILFTIGIVTTFSTTVFIAYFIFVAGITLLSPKISKLSKVLLFSGTLICSLYLSYNLSFLQEKINVEITELDKNIETTGDSRMAGATLDLIEISQNNLYIFFGKGSDFDSRVAGVDKKVQRNCGLTGLLIEWGVFFFIMYISLLYYSFHQLSRIHGLNTLFAIPFTLCILIVSFSEVFFDLPLFHTFIFFGFVVKRYYRPSQYDSVERGQSVESNYTAFV